MIGLVPKLQAAVVGWGFWPQWSLTWLKSPTGPFTIFFYCPLAKWLISYTNIKDMQKPIEQVNTLQQCVIALSGSLFTRWSMIITPKNPSLAVCNFCMGLTGFYQLYRKQQAGQLF